LPRIDFYVLPGQSPSARELLACRLAEKAYQLGHRVYIHVTSAEQAQRLDDLLWTFRQGSFVPHCLGPITGCEVPPVIIGWQGTATLSAIADGYPPDSKQADLNPFGTSAPVMLINLAQDIPEAFQSFERVAELVDQDPHNLEKSRERFRYYRDCGYQPKSHKVKPEP
jgi:DNA polymerase-3 subunit chi